MTMFREGVTQIHTKMVGRQCESYKVVALLDMLLPKLISGELWIKDAGRFVNSWIK